MVISDANKGLVKAIKETFVNVIWQRCQVHFLRNILSKSLKKNTWLYIWRLLIWLNTVVIHSRLKSKNCLEWVNNKVRSWEKLIRIFTNEDSAVRLIGASSSISRRIGSQLLNCILESDRRYCTSKFTQYLCIWIKEVVWF